MSKQGTIIGLITPLYAPSIGGVERHVEELAKELQRLSCRVEVITTDPSGKLPAVESRGGVLVRRFPVVGRSTYALAPQLSAWLLRNAYRFAIFHAHSYHTPLALQVAAVSRWAQVPLLITPHYHGTGHSRLRRALHVPYRAFGNWMMHQASCVIAVSETERSLLLRHFGLNLRTAVALNGVDSQPLLRAWPFSKSERRIDILTVGRLEEYKRIDRLVAALPHLPPEYHLTVVGNGPAHAQIAQVAAEVGVSSRVHLLGHVSQSDLLSWYKTADVFVSLSEHEAFGLTLLEAAVAGAAVAVSDIPPHREVARYVPGGRISFVEVAASAGTLARAILESPRLQRPVSIADWPLPTWAKMAERVLHCYESVLGRQPTLAIAEVLEPAVIPVH